MELIAGIKRLLVSPADEPGTLWRASWRGVVVAESDRTVVVEGNRYFPPDSLRREHLEPSRSHTICLWKGLASYYHVAVGGEVNPDAAWYYPSPSPLARRIKDHVAFWHGVQVRSVHVELRPAP
jgi:uncharacterized protein (DUF427 family)